MTSSSRILIWAVLVLAAAFLLTTGGTYPGIASIEGHLIGQVLGFVVLGGWLLVSIVAPAWRPRTPLLIPVAVASLAFAASAIASERPRLSLEPTIAGLAWAFAFLFLGRLLADGWFRTRALVLLTAFVAVVAMGYIGQVAAEWIAWWGVIGRFALPPLRPSFAGLFLGSPNLIATALILVAPLVVAAAWGRGRQRVAILLAVASAIAVLLSGSRGAYLGVGIGALVGFGLFAVRGFDRALPGRLASRVRGRPVLLLIPALVAVALAALAPALVQRFAQGGATIRVDLWRSALEIFAQHPVLGAGPGTWVQLKVEANPDGVQNLILPHAHDMYVQAAAELGVIGLGALLLLGLAVVRRIWTAWRAPATTTRAESVPNRRLHGAEAGAVLVSLGAFAGQSIVDNLVNLPFVCLLLVTMVAWVDGGLAADPASQAAEPALDPSWSATVRARLVSIVGLAALAVAAVILVRIDHAALLAQDGNAAALRGDWASALTAFDDARQLDPGFTLYEIQTAGALARIGRTAEARDRLAIAVESDPLAVNLVGLATLEAELGNDEAALDRAAEAAELGWGEPTVALNVGLIRARFGDAAGAVDSFANAVAWDPPLARSELWSSAALVGSRDEIFAAARSRIGLHDAALVTAYAGRPTDARRELEALPASSQREVYLAATDWLDRDAGAALASLDALLAASPHDWYMAAWAARIARQSGNLTASDRYAAWAIAVQGDAAPSVIAELSMVPAGPDAQTAGLPGNYPWVVYLRPISPSLLMPGVVLIGER